MPMRTRLDLAVSESSRACQILLDAALAELPSLADGRRAVLLVDANVRRLHGHALPAWPVVEVGIGEGAKTLATIEHLARTLVAAGVDRSTLLVGVGGGVTCDVTGFLGSILLRGLPFGFVATTLVAQVDAAIGGKNGVNLDGYKNLIGTFTQPEFVVCDHGFLSTLPAREMGCGMAEAIKTAAIGDARLFTRIEADLDAVLACDHALLAPVVEGAARTKVRIVAADERERGPRQLLNFGHTLGHGVEKVFAMSHGEAVAIGMVAAARLSVRRGLLAADDGARLERLLARAGLPTAWPEGRWPDLVEAMRRDKKRHEGRQLGVLLRAIGDGVVVEIDDAEWREACA
jgi:3-dehydroquinate synthase